MKSVSVSFLVVFRNLIAVFVAAFEFFVQVLAFAFAILQPSLITSLRPQGQGISMGRLGGLLAMLQVLLYDIDLCPHPVNKLQMFMHATGRWSLRCRRRCSCS